MTTRQHIGARYIPVFADPVEWTDDRTYEALMMVQHLGETYMSRQAVPIGAQLPGTEHGEESTDYWVHMSNWNAQVESYRQEVLAYNGRISTLENDLPLADFDDENTVSAAIANVQDQIGSGFSQSNTIAENLAERAICFDTVADMKASDNLADGMVCRTNGFHAANDGGAAWYVVSDTGTANEMDVIACGDLYATLMHDGDYVCPEMFGAVADGVEDDTSILSYMKSYCENNNVEFRLLDGKSYKISTTLEIGNLNVNMLGKIVYGGNGTAIQIGEADSSVRPIGKYRINVESGNDNYIPNSIGVAFYNVVNSEIHIEGVSGFEKGAQFIGYNTGCAYNTVYINAIGNCLHCLEILSNGTTGWANENLFIGGRLYATSASTIGTNKTWTGVYMDSEHAYNSNANVFINPCIENAGTSVHVVYGSFNRFYDVRAENTTNPYIQDNGMQNKITFTYNSTVSSGVNYQVQNQYGMNYINQLVYDSGFLPLRSFSSANYLYSGDDISYYYPTASGEFGRYAYHGVKQKDKILPNNRVPGVFVDPNGAKVFGMSGLGYGRCMIIMYDENGQYITTGLKYKSTQPFACQTDHTYNEWTTGGDSNFAYFEIPDTCKKFWVGFSKVNGFKLFSDSNLPFVINDNFADHGIDVIPNCAGEIGDYCKAANASHSGWYYNGSAWTAVS